MAIFASFLSCSPLPLPTIRCHCGISPAGPFTVNYPTRCFIKSSNLRTLVLASSTGGEFIAGYGNSRSKKSVLSNLIHEIEPLDVSLIQKDVQPTTIDAMKRTISGMLGLLPSDRFQVMIDALWEPLSKLLISSMMTGYTLRNAEHWLCLEKNLEIYEGHIYKQNTEDSKLEGEGLLINEDGVSKIFRQDNLPLSETTSEITSKIPDLGEMSLEAREYMLRLQSRLSSVRKVAELSEPTSPELKDAIHSVVHGLLATLSPKMHSKAPDLSDDPAIGTIIIETEEDCIDLVENTSLQFQPLNCLTRDYLARLLFWCMLLGHYLRGLEYRLGLMELLSLPCVEENGSTEE
ncbi:uncharacterized protein LOC111410645 isoform X2 [Olea europaea var. sylvestris]|uniref:uncharacterized protein LOC111410645 isoform X2 n=1 Tax=Olea europaea var. sylvestris TaxID=158386 RepID=UPI000C1D5805|nr:uncharacterized protein LOC111410645 isoform X2 [Olea europaea var. sylvestris]